MPHRKPIVVVGSINTDLVSITRTIPAIGETVVGSEFQMHPGGKGANQAVAVAKLGYPVQLIGRLGADSFGKQLQGHLERSGVNVDGVATSEGATGVAMIVVSEKGENSIVVTPGANALLTRFDMENNIRIIQAAGIVLTQLEIPIDTVECLASICKREAVPLILDPAPAMDLPEEIFKKIDWFTPNQTEAAFYCQGRLTKGETSPAALAEVLRSRGAHGVVLKLGAEGAYLLPEGESGIVIPPWRMKAIDTTAAGDAFNGGFAAGLMMGKRPHESARFASAVAAISVTRAGAQPSMPSMVEVNELLRTSDMQATAQYHHSNLQS